MHRIAIPLMFCSATCGVAENQVAAENNACSEEALGEWKPKFLEDGNHRDGCKVARKSHCIAKSELSIVTSDKAEVNPWELAKQQAELAKQVAKKELKKAKDDLRKAKKNARKDMKKTRNQQLSACWTMDRLDNWLTKMGKGQCANKQGDLFYGIRVWTPTIEKCIQMLADSPMAVGLSWEPKKYAGLPYGGLSGGCRLLYENSLGHITEANGDEAFECYVRKSSLKDDPPVTTVDDVSLDKVEGKGYCLNSKGEANYAGTTTSKHIVTTESTCFQMFEDGLPEAVGMYYYHPDSRCRVLYDHSSIGEITQSSSHEDYTCYKRSAPADSRRLQAEEALPMV